MRIKNILFSVLLTAVSVSQVIADEFDDGLAAFNNQDYKTAFQLFKSSAQQGNAHAQVNLGLMYDDGQGVLQNYAEAVKWYRLAAQQGESVAQHSLALSYGLGRGVPKDFVKAHLWFNIAAISGDVNSRKFREGIATKMTPKQLATAQKMAKDCLATKFKGCN